MKKINTIKFKIVKKRGKMFYKTRLGKNYIVSAKVANKVDNIFTSKIEKISVSPLFKLDNFWVVLSDNNTFNNLATNLICLLGISENDIHWWFTLNNKKIVLNKKLNLDQLLSNNHIENSNILETYFALANQKELAIKFNAILSSGALFALDLMINIDKRNLQYQNFNDNSDLYEMVIYSDRVKKIVDWNLNLVNESENLIGNDFKNLFYEKHNPKIDTRHSTLEKFYDKFANLDFHSTYLPIETRSSIDDYPFFELMTFDEDGDEDGDEAIEDNDSLLEDYEMLTNGLEFKEAYKIFKQMYLVNKGKKIDTSNVNELAKNVAKAANPDEIFEQIYKIANEMGVSENEMQDYLEEAMKQVSDGALLDNNAKENIMKILKDSVEKRTTKKSKNKNNSSSDNKKDDKDGDLREVN